MCFELNDDSWKQVIKFKLNLKKVQLAAVVSTRYSIQKGQCLLQCIVWSILTAVNTHCSIQCDQCERMNARCTVYSVTEAYCKTELNDD